ncbi:hypothetical protein [Plasticicumulans acidivorans]|uniref:Nucleoside-specific outer membrane channel protein Tsx n=1 Tax=Plasticicumulans acidivorans TaxID=886464 RepID=A0A317MW20_9GAMM|nr:hypothetical protein [Plasticicumulans acidivorans]PWV62406.1 hypothetical protein C7443_104201 [Plasticicumulans acidivorans]
MPCARPPAVLAALAFGLSAPLSSHAAGFSDTFIGYRYGNQFSEPSKPDDISKNIVQFTHASSYKLGSNFFNLDMLMSDDNDPAHNSDDGATEFYATFRSQLHASKVFDRDFKYGIIRDLGLTFGFDANTKDTTFAPRKRLIAIGPTLKFDVPGFFDLSFMYTKEWNHKGIPGTPDPDHEFDGTYMISAAWAIPFSVHDTPMKFQGFANYIGPKGEDYNYRDTEAEFLLRTSLMVDVGKLVADSKGTLFAGVGYEYWHNKFGNPPGVGTFTRTPTLNLEWHF